MPKLTVKLDAEVFEALRRHRWTRGEGLNDLLRRVMELDRRPLRAEPERAPWGKPWRRGAVELPHGTEIRMTHAGRRWYGAVVQGEWLLGRERFPGPEEAARRIAEHRGAETARPDPWLAWNVRLPGRRQWSTLASMRGSD